MQAWQRTWVVVFVANLITAIGMMSFLPFFPSYLEELGVTERAGLERWTGLIFGAAPLSAAIMGPVWGSIGDRTGRKLMVLRAMAAIALFVGAMGFVRSPWELLGLRILQGVFSGFIPPSITLVSVSAPRELQGRITGSLHSALNAGSIAGPLIGAAIEHTLGHRAVFFFVAAMAAASAALIWFLAEEQPILGQTLASWSPTAVLKDTWRDLSRLLTNANMRGALTILFCVQLGFGATNPLIELQVRDLWRGDPEQVEHLTAWLFTAVAVAGLFATPLWGRLGDRIGHLRALSIAAALTGVGLIAHGFVGVYSLLVCARILIGLVTSGPNASAFGVAALETAPERRGNAFAAVFSARAFAVSFGAMGGGAVASWVGMRGLFVVAGVLPLVLIGVLWSGRQGRTR